MLKDKRHRSSAAWQWGLLAVLAAVLAGGCGDVNVGPLSPTPTSPGTGVGIRMLHITGTLTAEQGGCVEARVLYDGTPLPNSTVVCPDESGCARLALAGETTTTAGRHTLALQVLRQQQDSTVYLAEVTVRMTREGLTFVLPLSPSPVRTALRAGDAVSFALQFVD